MPIARLFYRVLFGEAGVIDDEEEETCPHHNDGFVDRVRVVIEISGFR